MTFKTPISVIFFVLIFTGSTDSSSAQQTDYEELIESASQYYLRGNEIPDSILLKMVPENYEEFDKYYETTGPDHKLGKTDFFYETTQWIFDKVIVEKNDSFYIPSLNLASFADGEFAENFRENLLTIINMDNEKFCNSIDDIKLNDRNPIKYYADKHKCK